MSIFIHIVFVTHDDDIVKAIYEDDIFRKQNVGRTYTDETNINEKLFHP